MHELTNKEQVFSQAVDYVRLIGILAVILGHISSPYSSFIFQWHMPLFFIIGGMFVSKKYSIKEFVIRNFKRLMIPYFAFCVLGVVVEIAKRALLHRDPLNLLDTFVGVIYYMDYNHLVGHYGFILWFLPALFVAKIFLKLCFDSKTIVITLIAIPLILLLVYKHIFLPFGFSSGALGFAWLIFGTVLYHLYLRYRWSIETILALICVLIAFYILLPTWSLNMASFSCSNWLVAFMGSCIFTLGLLCSFVLSSFVLPNIHLLSSFCFMAYVFHVYTNNVAVDVFKKIGCENWLGIFVSSVALLCLMFIGILLFKKCMRHLLHETL